MNPTDLDSRLQRLEVMLEKVLENQQTILKDLKKTNSHVDFVESVYEQVKNPFSKVLTFINGSRIEVRNVPSIKASSTHEH